MKNSLILFTFILLASCSQNANNSSNLSIDLDSASINKTIEGLVIKGSSKNQLFVDTIVKDYDDFVYFTSNDGELKVNQARPILFNERIYNGKIIRKFNNGRIKYEAMCKKGFLEGEMKQKDSIGNPVIISFFVKGQLDSIFKKYYKNGKLERLINLKNGKQNGSEKSYHENGVLAFEGNYINDEKDGKHIYYYEDGKLRYVGNYSFGKRANSFFRDSIEMGYRSHGEFVEYFENGSIKYKATYQNGRPEGLVLANYNSKQIEYKENWEKGKITGQSERYYENGQLNQIGSFNENGVEIGEWKEYYENGKPRLSVKFDKGKIIKQHFYGKINKENSKKDLRSIFPGSESRY